MVDIIAGYLETVGERRVFPDVKPGYMLALVPPDAPDHPEEWDSIVEDIYNVIIPGVSVKFEFRLFEESLRLRKIHNYSKTTLYVYLPVASFCSCRLVL